MGVRQTFKMRKNQMVLNQNVQLINEHVIFSYHLRLLTLHNLN